MSKWVYSFGAGRPRARPRWSRCSAARAPTSPRWPARPAGAAGLHADHRDLQPLLRARPALSGRSESRGRGGPAPGRGRGRQRIRRPRAAAAAFGPLGRAGLDARHDGHGAQSRAERSDRRGAGAPGPAMPRFAYDSYRRFIQMYGDVVLGLDHFLFEEQLEELKLANGYALDTELGAEDLRRADRGLPGDRRGPARQSLSAGRPRAALGRDRRRVRLLDDAARGHLPAPARHRRGHGHRGQRAGDGVRQSRRRQRHRRRLHPRSLDRREALLRRVSDQRPGRGRRRRHPHAAAADHRHEGADRRRPAGDGRGRCRAPMRELVAVFERLEDHYRDMQDIEFTVQSGRLWILQTRRGKRTTQAALRIAVEHGRGGRDRPRRGGAAHRARLARAVAASDARPRRAARDDRAGPAGLARARCRGQVVFSADEAERLGSGWARR